MEQNNVKAFYENLEEKWQKDIFVMKLETIINLVNDSGFPEGLLDVVMEFIQLDGEVQESLIKEFKIKNQIREWADSGVDISEFIS